MCNKHYEKEHTSHGEIPVLKRDDTEGVLQ